MNHSPIIDCQVMRRGRVRADITEEKRWLYSPRFAFADVDILGHVSITEMVLVPLSPVFKIRNEAMTWNDLFWIVISAIGFINRSVRRTCFDNFSLMVRNARWRSRQPSWCQSELERKSVCRKFIKAL